MFVVGHSNTKCHIPGAVARYVSIAMKRAKWVIDFAWSWFFSVFPQPLFYLSIQIHCEN